MIQIFIKGLILCMGLIVSIGPQNAELIRSGLCKQSVLLLATTYILCDCFLITLGGFGICKIIPSQLIPFLAMAAIILLIGMAKKNINLLYHRNEYPPKISIEKQRLEKNSNVVFKGIGLALFNPMALMETLIILGGAALHYSPTGKLSFCLGAISASTIWFYGVAYISSKCANTFSDVKKMFFVNLIATCLLVISIIQITYSYLF